MCHSKILQRSHNLISGPDWLQSFSKRASSYLLSWKISASMECSWLFPITTPSISIYLNLRRPPVRTKSDSPTWTTIQGNISHPAWRHSTQPWRTSITWSIMDACSWVCIWRASVWTSTNHSDSGKANSQKRTISIAKSLKNSILTTSVTRTVKKVSAMITSPGTATRPLIWLHQVLASITVVHSRHFLMKIYCSCSTLMASAGQSSRSSWTRKTQIFTRLLVSDFLRALTRTEWLRMLAITLTHSSRQLSHMKRPLKRLNSRKNSEPDNQTRLAKQEPHQLKVPMPLLVSKRQRLLRATKMYKW